MDELITREEMDRRLKDIPLPQRDKHSDWRGRMEWIRDGHILALYPTDERHRHILDTTARGYARQYGIKIKTRKIVEDGQLTLFISLA